MSALQKGATFLELITKNKTDPVFYKGEQWQAHCQRKGQYTIHCTVLEKK